MDFAKHHIVSVGKKNMKHFGKLFFFFFRLKG